MQVESVLPPTPQPVPFEPGGSAHILQDWPRGHERRVCIGELEQENGREHGGGKRRRKTGPLG